MRDLEPSVEGESVVVVSPAIVLAMNIIREDNGGPHWPVRSESRVPARWGPFLKHIEAGLAELDSGLLSDSLEGEMWTFCAGEESEMEALLRNSPELQLASCFLQDFFDGWTRFH